MLENLNIVTDEHRFTSGEKHKRLSATVELNINGLLVTRHDTYLFTTLEYVGFSLFMHI